MTVVADTEPGWHVLRASWYSQDRARLITEAIGPALAQIDPLVAAAYYLPHWRQGPHVRLYVRCAGDTFDQRVRPAVDATLGAYLRRVPPGPAPDPDALLEEHRRLAEVEADSGPLLPWPADHSLDVMPYQSRADVIGSAAAADLLADCYVTATPLALAMTKLPRPARAAVAFELLIATAELAGPGGAGRAFVAFHSHAEAFLNTAADGQLLRQRWEQRYACNATALSARVASAAEAVREARPLEPMVGAWVSVLRRYLPRIVELVAADLIRLDGVDPTGAGPLASVAAVSPFHRQLSSQDWWLRELAPSAEFKLYRVALNLAYLHLTRVLITPVERFGLCYLAARASEDAYGVTADELVERRASVGGPR